MEAKQQAIDLFDKFKKLHPLSNEEFEFSLDNIQRWQHSIRHAEVHAGKEYKTFGQPNDTSARHLAESRAVGSFVRLPRMFKEKFLELASMFPGRKVYATGSRITGEYVEKDSSGAILQMRIDLLKKKTEVSDYDITLDYVPTDDYKKLRKLMPAWGDLVAKVPPGEPKIEIPMWDFSKLPVDLYNDIIDLYNNHQWGKLMAIHNDYELSDSLQCCREGPVIRWFKYAIDNKLIYKITDDAAQEPIK